MVLPNSKLVVRYATGYHDWEHGCTSLTKCYWPNFWLSVAAGKLMPDVVSPIRFADYVSGRDTALEAVQSLIDKEF